MKRRPPGSARETGQGTEGPPLALAVSVAGNLPHFLREGIKRCRRIASHPAGFPELTGNDVCPEQRFRKRRPSYLRAIALVSMSMAEGADIASMRVGRQRDDGLCSGRSIQQHADRTGVHPRTVARVLSELEGRWWSSVQPVVELKGPNARRGNAKEGGRCYAGLPSVRVLTPLFWKRLGFTSRRVAKARKAAADRRLLKRERAAAASVVRLRAAVRSVGDVARQARRDADRARADTDRLERIARLEAARGRPPPVTER